MLPRIQTTLLLIGLGMLAGCASPAATPHWDARFGMATRAAFAAQVLHPEAARDGRPVDGMDGPSAAAAQQRYQKSFAEPPSAASPFTIGVSGAK
ncbi:hypothetical protein IP91_03889 [Pseudoduganella lurida]|uniref:Pilus assembly protein n=1 Tax=Pseudoduganella lurida TaxID=1036180 RepID=A0A562R1W5_9BURK|nr:hypothetical protein [Pseudoduganella lurida]TWI63049.1 hypothetical protein IP91_03889 [Pseudoduganella lurida]